MTSYLPVYEANIENPLAEFKHKHESQERYMQGLEKLKIAQGNEIYSDRVKGLTETEHLLLMLLIAKSRDKGTSKFYLKREYIEVFTRMSNPTPGRLSSLFESLKGKIDSQLMVNKPHPYRAVNEELEYKPYFSTLEYIPSEEVAEVRPSPYLAKLTTNLTTNYTQYEFGYIHAIKGIYARKLLNKLMQFNSTGVVRVESSDLRRILDVPKSYSTGKFHQRILYPAFREVTMAFSGLTLTILKKGSYTNGKVRNYTFKYEDINSVRETREERASHTRSYYSSLPVEEQYNLFNVEQVKLEEEMLRRDILRIRHEEELVQLSNMTHNLYSIREDYAYNKVLKDSVTNAITPEIREIARDNYISWSLPDFTREALARYYIYSFSDISNLHEGVISIGYPDDSSTPDFKKGHQTLINVVSTGLPIPRAVKSLYKAPSKGGMYLPQLEKISVASGGPTLEEETSEVDFSQGEHKGQFDFEIYCFEQLERLVGVEGALHREEVNFEVDELTYNYFMTEFTPDDMAIAPVKEESETERTRREQYELELSYGHRYAPIDEELDRDLLKADQFKFTPEDLSYDLDLSHISAYCSRPTREELIAEGKNPDDYMFDEDNNLVRKGEAASEGEDIFKEELNYEDEANSESEEEEKGNLDNSMNDDKEVGEGEIKTLPVIYPPNSTKKGTDDKVNEDTFTGPYAGLPEPVRRELLSRPPRPKVKFGSPLNARLTVEQLEDIRCDMPYYDYFDSDSHDLLVKTIASRWQGKEKARFIEREWEYGTMTREEELKFDFSEVKTYEDLLNHRDFVRMTTAFRDELRGEVIMGKDLWRKVKAHAMDSLKKLYYLEYVNEK